MSNVSFAAKQQAVVDFLRLLAQRIESGELETTGFQVEYGSRIATDFNPAKEIFLRTEPSGHDSYTISIRPKRDLTVPLDNTAESALSS